MFLYLFIFMIFLCFFLILIYELENWFLDFMKIL